MPDASASFVRQFAELCRFLDIRSLADAGCGDFAWMDGVSRQFTLYIGLDRSEIRIADLDYLYGKRQGHFFACRDVSRDPLPSVDAILCRDLFAEQDIRTVSEMLDMIKQSGSRYLMASFKPGAGAPLDLTASPFNLPLPLLQFPDGDAGTLMGVWLINPPDP
jgi:hypothetical protein